MCHNETCWVFNGYGFKLVCACMWCKDVPRPFSMPHSVRIKLHSVYFALVVASHLILQPFCVLFWRITSSNLIITFDNIKLFSCVTSWWQAANSEALCKVTILGLKWDFNFNFKSFPSNLFAERWIQSFWTCQKLLSHAIRPTVYTTADVEQHTSF